MEAYLQYRRLRKSVKQSVDSDKVDNSRNVPSDTNNRNDIEDVNFAVSDPQNPQNWSVGYKIFCTSIIWLLTFVTGWASAVDSVSLDTAGKDLHVSKIAEALATSMYMFGVGAGALFVGPCSETLGRLPTYLLTFALYLVWIMATALAPNFTAQIVFRLCAGVFAAASMSIYGGSLADLFDVHERAWLWPFFALSPLLGENFAFGKNGSLTDKSCRTYHCPHSRWLDRHVPELALD